MKGMKLRPMRVGAHFLAGAGNFPSTESVSFFASHTILLIVNPGITTLARLCHTRVSTEALTASI